jgi:hypothetical protein
MSPAIAETTGPTAGWRCEICWGLGKTQPGTGWVCSVQATLVCDRTEAERGGKKKPEDHKAARIWIFESESAWSDTQHSILYWQREVLRTRRPSVPGGEGIQTNKVE